MAAVGARGRRASCAKKYRLLREAAYQQGVEEFDDLDKDPTFREFVSMYIGEGLKRSRNRVAVGNSDAAVMQLAIYWLRRLTERPLVLTVHLHADQNADDVCAFWGDKLRVDPTSIRVQWKSNSGRLSGRTWRCRYGVFTVGSNDTSLRSRLQAWIDRLEARWRGLDSGELGV